MKKWPPALQAAVKIGLTGVILYLVFSQLDWQAAGNSLKRANPLWVTAAVAGFVLSKVISAIRFKRLLQGEGFTLASNANLRLYWIGMYYNLLLPGGISGDGYKIKLLHDATGHSVRRLVVVALLDRIGGAIALGQIVLVLAIFLPILQPWWAVWILGLAISVPATAWIFRRIGGPTQKIVWKSAALQSLGVQCCQLLASLALLAATGYQGHWVGYSILFLVSSVVAMLPLTVGGTGARELTFLYGARIFGLDAGQAVAVAFLFYLVSTGVALSGAIFSFKEKDLIFE